MPTLTHQSATDHVLTLGDGRRLGYTAYGDPEGLPVLNCHGGLLCRLDVEPADEAARRLGICLVSPDRPGVGLSGRQPGRSTVDWAADVRELVDQLGIDRFAVMGWSLGGQYAAALAARLGDRVTRTAVVAGCVPLDEPVALSQLNAMDLRFGRLSRHCPPAARAAFRTMAGVAAHRPGMMARASGREACPADQAAYLAYAELLGRAMTEGL
ncbi:MAG TPA: alpha/beta hydrolase, partial [Acidimicrobiales bacterium]